MIDAKYRFSELMSAISMLPSVDMDNNEPAEEAQDWVFPDTTKGLANPNLRNAILCQAFREDREFQFKLVACLSNSAIANMKANSEPCKDDLEALSIALNVLWGAHQYTAMFGLGGLLSSVCASTNNDLPDLALAFLQQSDSTEKFAKLDPIALAEGNIADEVMREFFEMGE